MLRLYPRAAAVGAVLALAAFFPAAPSVRAQSAKPSGDYVSRDEYDQLKREHDQMRQELEEMRQLLKAAKPAATAAPATSAQAVPAIPGLPAQRPAVDRSALPGVHAVRGRAPAIEAAGPTDQDLDEIDKQIKGVRDFVKDIAPGSSNFLLAGDAAITYSSIRHTTSSFSAGIAPLILYQPTKDILVEGALDIGLNTDPTSAQGSTSVDLTIADVTYIVNDYLEVGAGLFVCPFGVYHNRYDPPWINKLPDDPIVFSDGGLAPGSVVGAFALGSVPVQGTRLEYNLYVSNGPSLVTDDPAAAGSLRFDNYSDINEDKAIGGRIGWQPVPQCDIGYSVQIGKASPAGFKNVHAFLQAVDFAYRREIGWLMGTLDFRAEWIWSDVSPVTYHPTGSGALRFNNFRNGGYVMLAYRPNRVDNKFIRNLEFVVRYDMMNVPTNAPGGDREDRWTFGLDYWLTPATVVKFAWEHDHRKVNPAMDGFLMQLGIGL